MLFYICIGLFFYWLFITISAQIRKNKQDEIIFKEITSYEQMAKKIGGELREQFRITEQKLETLKITISEAINKIDSKDSEQRLIKSKYNLDQREKTNWESFILQNLSSNLENCFKSDVISKIKQLDLGWYIKATLEDESQIRYESPGLRTKAIEIKSLTDLLKYFTSSKETKEYPEKSPEILIPMLLSFPQK